MSSVRKMPFLSEVIFTLMNAIVSALHLIAPSLSTVVSTGMIGALFALMLPPALIFFGGFMLLDVIIPQLNGYATYYFALPLLLLYILQIIVLDKSHLIPQSLGAYRAPETFLQKTALKFWLSHFDYFPLSIVAKESVQLPPSKQYVFAVHPHGIHCWPLNALAFVQSPFDKRFPGLVGEKLTGLAATVIFKIPVIRELFITMGYVDARRAVAEKALSIGRSIFVCTGGEDEAMRTTPGIDTVVLRNRKGFVRLALSYGCTIVPVFGVGVSDLYQTYDLFTLSWRRRFQKATGIALPIFHGKWFTSLPYKVPIEIMIGEGIDTPSVNVKGCKVDEALVDEYHEKYVQALQKMYLEHCGARGRKLEII